MLSPTKHLTFHEGFVCNMYPIAHALGCCMRDAREACVGRSRLLLFPCVQMWFYSLL